MYSWVSTGYNSYNKKAPSPLASEDPFNFAPWWNREGRKRRERAPKLPLYSHRKSFPQTPTPTLPPPTPPHTHTHEREREIWFRTLSKFHKQQCICVPCEIWTSKCHRIPQARVSVFRRSQTPSKCHADNCLSALLIRWITFKLFDCFSVWRFQSSIWWLFDLSRAALVGLTRSSCWVDYAELSAAVFKVIN